MPLLPLLRHNPMQAHQPGDMVMPAHHALALQDDPDARTAVGFPTGAMFRADLFDQDLIRFWVQPQFVVDNSVNAER